MQTNTIKRSSLEKTIRKSRSLLSEYRYSLLASLIVGLLSYVFAFTNKLINHDEVIGLFAKGSGLDSGRWALDFTPYLFPNYSMPWIYGIITIALISISSVLMIHTLKIKNHLLQALLSGLVMSFPSLIGTFSYMFTASSYALAFLLSTLFFFLFVRKEWYCKVCGIIALTISAGIYQSYISVASTLLLIYLLGEVLFTEKSFSKLLKEGLWMLFGLAVSVGAYYGIMQILLHITGTELNSYASAGSQAGGSILEKLISAYSGFLDILLERKFALITTRTSRIAHLLMGLFSAIVFFVFWLKQKGSKKLLSLLIVALIPLSINCMFLISPENSIHTLVLYSFIGVYAAFAILIDHCDFSDTSFAKIIDFISKEVITWGMLLVIVINIYIANTVYLRMHLCYENMYGYYSTIVTQIKSTPGYDTNDKIAFVGLAGNGLHFHTEFDAIATDIAGTHGINVNSYTRNDFIKSYIGAELLFAGEAEIEEIKKTEEFAEMPLYPDYGSIREIGDLIVVKFQE